MIMTMIIMMTVTIKMVMILLIYFSLVVNISLLGAQIGFGSVCMLFITTTVQQVNFGNKISFPHRFLFLGAK